jgi:four helix bundle protein
MRDFRTLLAWQRSHAFALGVYKLTAGFPREELYLLTNQMRDSAASVPTNIAEGCGTDGLDFARFLQMAMRSASELDYQLILARDLGYVSAEAHLPLERELHEVKRMLIGLIRKVRSDVRSERSRGSARLTNS